MWCPAAEIIRRLSLTLLGEELLISVNEELTLSVENAVSAISGKTTEQITVEMYHGFDTIVSMQKEWDRFMESVGGDIFLTFDWCRVWWKYYGGKRDLAILVFRGGQDIRGILPLCREKIWIGPVPLNVVKIVATDYLPVTVTVPIHENSIDQIVKILIERMRAQWQWDLFYVGDICGRYECLDKFVNALKGTVKESYRCEVTSRDVQTYFYIAADWDSQVAALAPKQRTNVKRTFREVSATGATVRSVIATRENFLQMFNRFVEMHQTYWRRGGKPGHFGAWPASVEFHREIAGIQLAHDRLRLVEISLDEQIVGYEYIYRFDGVYSWFLNAREEPKNSPRIDYKWIAFRTRVECAIADNVTCVDGMRGMYDYKLAMGGKLLPVNDVFVYSTKFLTLPRVIIFRLLARGLNICYNKIWRRRMAPRLGISLKSFWDKWIRFHPLSS